MPTTALKPLLILTLFLLCQLSNAVVADAHLQDGSHSNDSPHVHLPLDHVHGHDLNGEQLGAFDTEHQQQHEETHVHLCFHLLPLQLDVFDAIMPLNPRHPELREDYQGRRLRPPVPPPTA